MWVVSAGGEVYFWVLHELDDVRDGWDFQVGEEK